MSAAGRGERVERDQYPTPAWCVERLCESVPLPFDGIWCEPGAGAGHIIKAISSITDRCMLVPPRWTAFELDLAYRHRLRRLRAHVVTGCFLRHGARLAERISEAPSMRFDFGLGNPAYSITTQTVEVLRRICRTFALLLPMTYNGSAGRCDMFQRDQPDLYVLPNRPCFVRVKTILTDGRERITTSDSSEYAWFLWPEKPQSAGKIRVLNKTPVDVLRAAKEQAPIVYVDKRRRAA